jgi:large subunit ribosomal protein L17
MRHLKATRRLNRTATHRKAMFSNMLQSFFYNERLKTTTAKAKELRRLSEKCITRAKQNSLHNKRIILKRIQDRDVVAKLFDDIAPRYQNVNGGYTRIIKLGKRMGDGAELSLLELVGVKEKPPKSRSKGKKKEEKEEKAEK